MPRYEHPKTGIGASFSERPAPLRVLNSMPLARRSYGPGQLVWRQWGGLRDLRPDRAPLAPVASALLGCMLAACDGGGGGGGDRPVPAVTANVASMDAIGDSITKGFNAVSETELCPESEV